jgi:cytochrome P450
MSVASTLQGQLIRSTRAAQGTLFQASVPVIGRGWFVTRYDDVVTVARDDRFSRDILPLVRWLPRVVRVP